jgi:perosamine synthetase
MANKVERNIPLAMPQFDSEMAEAAMSALQNERFVLGESVCKFEEEFARYVGVKYAVSTSSGTNALQIAFLSLGVKKGDEVVTSAFSFVASANSVLHAGGIPVFADIDAGTYNVDPEKMKRRITKRTGALLPVHLYGYPCVMDEIRDLALDRGLKVVEDACQAHGAEYAGRRAGSIGDVGCFSFYPSKNMTVCGDGGMITTNDEAVAKLAAKLRDCGRKSQYEHDVVGYTSRLNTVNAAIGRVQLRRLDEWNRRRLEVAGWYDEGLAGVEGVVCPPRGGGEVKPVYHLYVVRAKRRDELREHLKSKGIATGVHYPLPISLQPVYQQMYNYKVGDYPLSEQASKQCLSLPIYPSMSNDDVAYVCEHVREFH